MKTSFYQSLENSQRHFPSLSLPSETREELDICIGIGCDITCLSVTSFSSQTSEARDLKMGMHIPQMGGSKVTSQILIFCPGFYIYVFNSSHNFEAREKFIN